MKNISRLVSQKPKRIFYGWWLIGVGFIAGVIQTVLFSLGFGAFFLPIAQEFNVTRGALSGVFSAARIQGGIIGPFAGYLVDKIGPRVMMTSGFLLFGAGLLVTSQVNSLVQFYGGFLVTGVGAYLCWYIPATTVAMNWFSRLRRKAISLVLMGSVAGGPLVPVLAWSIATFGWRDTLIGSAVFVWVIGVPLAMLIKTRPEDHGQYPDGSLSKESQSEEMDISYNRSVEYGLSINQTLHTTKFWYLAIAHSFSLLAWGAVSVHMIPAMVDIGLSSQFAAYIVGLTTGIAVVGRVWVGFFSGVLGTKLALIISLIFQSIALLSLGFATNIILVIFFAIFMGLGFGARGPLLVIFRGELFGRKSYATITGVLEPILMVGVVIGPVLAGFMYDFQDTYRIGFITIASLNLIGIFFLFPINPPIWQSK